MLSVHTWSRDKSEGSTTGQERRLGDLGSSLWPGEGGRKLMAEESRSLQWQGSDAAGVAVIGGGCHGDSRCQEKVPEPAVPGAGERDGRGAARGARRGGRPTERREEKATGWGSGGEGLRAAGSCALDSLPLVPGCDGESSGRGSPWLCAPVPFAMAPCPLLLSPGTPEHETGMLAPTQSASALRSPPRKQIFVGTCRRAPSVPPSTSSKSAKQTPARALSKGRRL